MTWHMASSLRAAFSTLAVLIAGVAVYLIVASFQPFDAVTLVLGLALVGVAVDIAATGWRSALIVDDDILTVRYAFRAREIKRAEIDAIRADPGGVLIDYTQGGRPRTTTADAGQGILNSIGGRLIRRETRTEQITDQLTTWWHAGNEQPQHPTRS